MTNIKTAVLNKTYTAVFILSTNCRPEQSEGSDCKFDESL